MNRESIFIFTTATVLSAGIVGGLYYLSIKELRQVGEVDESRTKPLVAVEQARQNSQSGIGRTNAIKKCSKPDGTEFWTNAVNCGAADLNNRISRADPVKPMPDSKPLSNSRRSGKSGNAGNSYAAKRSKRQLKSFPQGMPVSCKFPIGMARKIERKSLSIKIDPKDSIWKKSYCRWVCDARTEGCEDLDDYLEFIDLCPPGWRVDQRSCGAS